MILTNHEIRRRIDAGDIRYSPNGCSTIMGPNSLDLHLGPVLLRYDRTWFDRLLGRSLDPKRGLPPAVAVPRDASGGWVLRPGRLYLGHTAEHVGTSDTSDLVPYIDGRSSLARMGVAAHLAAGRGDIGFYGSWTLELVSFEHVRVRPGDRLFQMTFVRASGRVEGYRGRYGDSLGPLPSQFGVR